MCVCASKRNKKVTKKNSKHFFWWRIKREREKEAKSFLIVHINTNPHTHTKIEREREKEPTFSLTLLKRLLAMFEHEKKRMKMKIKRANKIKSRISERQSLVRNGNLASKRDSNHKVNVTLLHLIGSFRWLRCWNTYKMPYRLCDWFPFTHNRLIESGGREQLTLTWIVHYEIVFPIPFVYTKHFFPNKCHTKWCRVCTQRLTDKDDDNNIFDNNLNESLYELCEWHTDGTNCD